VGAEQPSFKTAENGDRDRKGKRLASKEKKVRRGIKKDENLTDLGRILPQKAKTTKTRKGGGEGELGRHRGMGATDQRVKTYQKGGP